MGHIVVETVIVAPREVVFDLARDVSAHAASAAFTRERAVPPGRTQGRLELGDTVTFEGMHFLLCLRFTARIVEFDRPVRFVDELVRSSFRRLRHEHLFEEQGAATIMRDTLEWVSPYGFLGRIADALFVTAHMRSFVTRKQLALKEIAERR
ncbi:MAG TPA: SRPBCC family protein [Thermoanaerobaculia bacterium]